MKRRLINRARFQIAAFGMADWDILARLSDLGCDIDALSLC